MGLCWNHTVTRTKQGSVGVIWAQQERSSGRTTAEWRVKGWVGGGNVWVGIAVKVLIVSQQSLTSTLNVQQTWLSSN